MVNSSRTNIRGYIVDPIKYVQLIRITLGYHVVPILADTVS